MIRCQQWPESSWSTIPYFCPFLYRLSVAAVLRPIAAETAAKTIFSPADVNIRTVWPNTKTLTRTMTLVSRIRFDSAHPAGFTVWFSLNAHTEKRNSLQRTIAPISLFSSLWAPSSLERKLRTEESQTMLVSSRIWKEKSIARYVV